MYRLTAENPERLNPQVLVALMNILDRTADNVIVKVRVLTAATTGTDGGGGGDAALTVLRDKGYRPTRASISPSPSIDWPLR
ncbi:hypothetical protein AZG88_48435 [Rhodococcus sp. LB1]|nr:hypothetical protein AZG88_48435 [Rhodococcus sp. LB1]